MTQLLDIDSNFVCHRRQSQEGWYCPRMNLALVQSMREDLVNHEYNHFNLHVATPYGAFYSGLNSLAERLVIDYCQQVRRDRPNLKIKTPIYDHALALKTRSESEVESSEDRKYFDEVMGKYIVPWSRLVSLMSLMEGGMSAQATGPMMLDGHQLLGEFERLWYARSGRAVPNTILAISAEDCMNGTGCPLSVLEDGRKAGIGASHLIEAVATMLESKAGFLLPDDETQSDDFVEYRLVWGWYVLQLLEAGIYDKTKFLQYRNTFLVLANVSLFIPAGPYFAELRPENSRWRDIHPGWRFIKAVVASLKLGLVENVQLNGLEYSDAVCRECGWPTVSEFLEFGENLDDNGELAELIRASFAHQKNAQKAVPDMDKTSENWNNFTHRFGLLTWVSANDHFVHAFQDAEACNHHVQRAIVSEWTWTVMLGGKPVPGQVFDFGVSFSTLFDNSVQSDADIYERLAETNPWMQPRHYENFE